MKLFNRITIFMSIIALVLLVGNVLMLSDMKNSIDTGAPISEWMGMAVAAFLIAIGITHLLGLFTLLSQFKFFKNDSLLRSTAFVTGFLSLLLLAVDVTMLSDIGNEYRAGFDISGEWQIVFAGHAVHMLFSILLLITCLVSVRGLSNMSNAETAVQDEALFLTVNEVGVISAVSGILGLFSLKFSEIPNGYFNSLVFLLSIIFLIPYCLVAAYWFYTKRKDKPSKWYDEKQFADVSNGALTTLVITSFLSAAVYLLLSIYSFEISMQVWIPFFLLFTLLLFSASTLFLSKRE